MQKTAAILMTLFCLVVAWMSYGKYTLHADTIDNGIDAKVEIRNTVCEIGKNANPKIYFEHNGRIRGASLSYKECEKHQPGDSIFVRYTEEHEMYYAGEITVDGEVTAIIMFLGIIPLVWWWYFREMKEARKERIENRKRMLQKKRSR